MLPTGVECEAGGPGYRLMPARTGEAGATMSRSDCGRQAPEREQGPAKSDLGRRVLVDALVAIVVAVVAVGGVILLVQHESIQLGPNRGDNAPGPGKGDNVPPYEFLWKGNAPGSLTAEQAYAAEAEVERATDGSDTPPVASLWVAQSADAALVVAQLDGQGKYLAVVPIVRVGDGSMATWQAAAGTWPPVRHCSASSLPSGDCGESTVSSPTGNPFAVIWDWSADDGTVGVAAQFAQPLMAGPSGGTLAGLTLSVGSAQEADGSTVVAVGTASAAQVQQRAASFAAAG